jgi:hypothetical protein
MRNTAGSQVLRQNADIRNRRLRSSPKPGMNVSRLFGRNNYGPLQTVLQAHEELNQTIQLARHALVAFRERKEELLDELIKAT